MKKLMFVFLTVMLFGLVFLSACGEDNPDSDTEDQNEPEEQQDEENTEEDVDSDAENEADNETDAGNDTEEETNEGDENESDQTDDSTADPEVVLENDAFRIYEPTPDAVVGNEFTVRGEARIFEATVMYEFEDGHNILDEGFVTASTGAPDWGEFEITISFDEVAHDTGTVILYEESQKDGSRLNEIFIPVKIEQ